MANIRIEYTFDCDYLIKALKNQINKANPSLADLELISGVSKSTLSRIANGHVPDMEIFMTICSRIELDPGECFVKSVWRKVETEE